MTQTERRLYLIRALQQEDAQYAALPIPDDEAGQRRLLRALFNLRMPAPASDAFLAVQDTYLQQELLRRGVTELSGLTPARPGIYLWQGDITTLRCDAIVNAANAQLLGCFCPCHGCIDNAIHTCAGVQLRLACAELMRRQGHEEETGGAKITPAFNLPSHYVLHTVGPIVAGTLTQKHAGQLAACYQSCLELASERGLKSVAFCCISTGEFRFPNDRAAEIAVRTVTEFIQNKNRDIRVIFNVYKDLDYELYRKLL